MASNLIAVASNISNLESMASNLVAILAELQLNYRVRNSLYEALGRYNKPNRRVAAST